MELVTGLIVFIVSIVMGFVGSTVGGAAIVKVPLLMLLGVPPAASVGTNKLTSIVGSSVSLREYHKKKFVELKEIAFLLPICFFAVMIGALITVSLDAQFLQSAIAVIIMLTVAFNMVKDRFKLKRLTSNRLVIAAALVPLFVYQGFLGAGVGSLLSLAMMMFFGYDFLKAAGTKLVFILVGAVAASVIYLSAGAVDFEMFLFMVTGSVIGNLLGPRFAIKNGEKIMKPLFYVISVAMAAKLLFF